jgi:hypothetical protein
MLIAFNTVQDFFIAIVVFGEELVKNFVWCALALAGLLREGLSVSGTT